MGKDKTEPVKDVVYTVGGKPIKTPIEITDSLRVTKCYESVVPIKTSLLSKVLSFFKGSFYNKS